jgi:Domain of unknown function (DUF6458)
MPAIGTSLLLVAVGAILRYAVTASVRGVDLTTVGLIVMISGILGLVLGVWSVVVHARRVPRPSTTEAFREPVERERY